MKLMYQMITQKQMFQLTSLCKNMRTMNSSDIDWKY